MSTHNVMSEIQKAAGTDSLVGDFGSAVVVVQ